MPTPEPLTARARRAGGWLELGLLVVAALGALIFHVTLPSRLPEEGDHRALAEVVAAERQPGDAVVLWPWWTERARLFLPEGLPVHGWLGVEGEDFVEAPRLWVVGQPRLPRSDERRFEEAFAPGRTAVGQTRRFGPLELRLFRNERHRPVLFSAVERVAEARVWLELPGGAPRPCAFDGTRHRCGGPTYVAAEWHELLYAPRRCLWMPPPGGETRLVAEFPPAPVGEQLLLEAGIIWEHAFRTDPALTPTRVSVENATTGERVAELTVMPGREGMERAPVTMAAGSASEPVPLRIAVESRNPEARQLCVELRTLGPRGATAGGER